MNIEIGFFNKQGEYIGIEMPNMDIAMATFIFYANNRQMFGMREVMLINWDTQEIWSTEPAMVL